jgi:NADPH2:quinone reductase
MKLEELEDSPPENGLVRIEIKASAINFFDALLVQGTYQVKPDFPFTPGAEVSGLVVSAPPGSDLVTGCRPALSRTRYGWADMPRWPTRCQ